MNANAKLRRLTEQERAEQQLLRNSQRESEKWVSAVRRAKQRVVEAAHVHDAAVARRDAVLARVSELRAKLSQLAQQASLEIQHKETLAAEVLAAKQRVAVSA